MKILMLAPEPFFSPRGTPFSEFHRIKALCRMGHTVDLVTYPIGRDIQIDGLSIHRCLNPFRFREIKTGPSLKKLILDLFLFLSALRRFLFKRYDLIHTHEEAALFAVVLRKMKRVPHLYDMHSSLVQQMDNFQTTRSSLVLGFFRWFERTVLRDAASVIVICRTLFDHAAQLTDSSRLTLIENFIDTTDGVAGLAESPSIPSPRVENEKTVFYAGTLEHYQGIPLLLEAMSRLPDSISLWLAGGRSNQVAELKELSRRLGLLERVHFFGQLSPEQIPPLIERVDLLVSPRSRGTNIPLKVYSYLKSGKPLVATDILSHTQTLTPEISILVKAQADDLARGITRALSSEGQSVAQAAARFCQENYTPERYHELVAAALDKTKEPSWLNATKSKK